MKIDNSWYTKPEGIRDRLVAGGVVIRKDNDRLLLLLIRGSKSNTYALPKGGVKDNEKLVEGAKREINEESGIGKLKLITKLGITERLTLEKDYWSICHYFLFETDQIKGKQNLEDDEDFIAEWFNINKLPCFFWPEQERLIKNNLKKIKILVMNSK